MISRSRLRLRALVAAGLATLALQAGAARIAEQTFDERLRLDGTELVLNGVGVRAVAWLQGYAAGLYLAEKAASPAQAIALRGPKRLQMRMLLEVPPKEFVKAIHKGMRRNHTPAEHAALADRIAQFDRNVEAIGTVRKGDVVDLDFVPGRGLVMSLNGRERGQAIPGEALYAGMLRIFIGDDPVDTRLKDGLLGKLPAE